MDKCDEMRTAVEAVLKREGIVYRAVFIPQSLSRNAGSKDKTLNWRITLFKLDKASMQFEYTQGIGHVPGYGFNTPKTVYETERFGNPEETGKYHKAGMSLLWCRLPLPMPSVAAIVHSIVFDDPQELDDPQQATFENWASDFGYDVDSRKAEQTYQACLKQTREAERVFGRAVLAELATLLQDY